MRKSSPLMLVDHFWSPTLRKEFKDPFNDLFDSFYDNFFHDSGLVQQLTTKRTYPKVDIYQEENDLVFEAAVPGMSKDQLSISLDNGVLSISGESQSQTEECSTEDKVKGSCILKELKKTSFVRRFTLSDSLNINSIEDAEANLENGILTIKFKEAYSKPELEEKKVTNIPIK